MQHDLHVGLVAQGPLLEFVSSESSSMVDSA